MVHILADLHVLGGSFPLGPRVAVLLVPLQPPHEAADDGQAGLLRAGDWAWLPLWLWLLVRKMQMVIDDEVLGVGVLLALLDGPEWNAGIGYLSGGRTLFTCSRGGLATGRCGGHASKQAGKALRSRGHPQRTKRSGILAILNKTKVCITKQQESQNNSG